MQFLKKSWIFLGLACLCVGGGYWIYLHTSWERYGESSNDPLNPTVEFYRKENGAHALVQRFPIDDLKKIKPSLDERIFRWSQIPKRGAECFVSGFPAAYATAIIGDGKTRRTTFYVATERYVDWIQMEFPVPANFTGELNQLLRTKIKWKGAMSDFRPIANNFVAYKFTVHKNRVIELPREWYSAQEQAGLAPMFRGGAGAHLLHFRGHRTDQMSFPSVRLYGPEASDQASNEEYFPEKELKLLKIHNSTPSTCSIKEYAGGVKYKIGRLIIVKGTEKCILNVLGADVSDKTDVLAEARPLAEHIAREWAKLPD